MKKQERRGDASPPACVGGAMGRSGGSESGSVSREEEDDRPGAKLSTFRFPQGMHLWAGLIS